MAVFRIIFGFTLAFLLGCLPVEKSATDNPIVGKVCTLIAGISMITIEIEESTDLPSYLIGSANGIVDFDECDPQSLGHLGDVSVIRRGPTSATVKLWLHYGSDLYQEFMAADEAPRPGGNLSLVLYGRNSCSDAPASFKTIQRPLTWQAHYANGSGCDATGFEGR